MDANFFYNYPLLNLGRCIWEYHNKVHPSRLAQAIVPETKQHYVTQLKEAFDAAQESVKVSASAGMDIYRRIMLLPPEKDIVRKEVVAVIGFILYVRLLDLHVLLTMGTVSKYVGCSICDDELQGAITARHAIGQLLECGKTLVLDHDDSLNLAPDFRFMMTIGTLPQDLGASGDEVRAYVQAIRESEIKKPQKKPIDIPEAIKYRMQWKPN